MHCLSTLSLRAFLLLAAAVSARADVVINEIMFHPQSENAGEEYVELKNTGAAPVDVSSWRLGGGVAYTIPAATTIPAGGYLVIAANGAAFSAKYPSVSSYVAGWTGRLSNAENAVELKNPLGVNVDEVDYADDGDWARRERDDDDLGFRGWRWRSDADGFGKSLELINAAFDNSTGQNWAASTTVQGTPGAANSVAATNIAPVIRDVSHFPLLPRSTDSVTVNARVTDDLGAAVTVSVSYRDDGAVSFANAPMFDDGAHDDGVAGDRIFGAQLPVRGSGTVVEYYVSATDGTNARTWPAPALNNVVQGNPFVPEQSQNCFYQVDDTNYAGTAPIYRVILKASDRLALVNINASAGTAASRATYNGTFISVDGTGSQLRYTSGLRNRGHDSASRQPQSFRVEIPNDNDWNRRTALDLNTQYTYLQLLGSAVMRRAGLVAPESRQVQVRVNGLDYTQIVGGTNNGAANNFGNSYAFYVCNEAPDSRFALHHFQTDPSGNVYRVRRTDSGTYQEGDLTYLGATTNPYRPVYFKETNVSADNWSDVIGLTQALAKGHFTTLTAPPTWDADYVSSINAKVDVAQWMRSFAVQSLMGASGTNLATGYGDDYAFYAGVADVRAKLIAWDTDAIFGHGDAAAATTDEVYKFIRHGATGAGQFAEHTPTVLLPLMRRPEFGAIFFQQLDALLTGPMSVANVNAQIDQTLTGVVDATTITARKNWYAARHAFVSGLLPRALSITSTPAVVSGYPQVVTPACNLAGRANVLTTASVKVNGTPASYVPWQVTGTSAGNVFTHSTGQWNVTGLPLTPGINRVLIQSFDASNAETERVFQDVWYDDGTVAAVTGALPAGTTTWTAAGGPYQLTGNVTVPATGTLVIQPGTTVYMNNGIALNVTAGGRILAEGTESQRIRFTRIPGGTGNGDTITINGSAGAPETHFYYTVFEFGGSPAVECASNSNVILDHCEWLRNTTGYLNLDGGSFIVSHCIFPTGSPTASFEGVHGSNAAPPAGGRAIMHDCFFGKIYSNASGYNDVFDFTGGNRPGPILQFYNNVMIGSDDDLLDIDGTDMWIEGNIFMHVHRSNSPDSASAISGGNDGGGGAGSRRDVSAINTATDVITCGTHGFSTGQEVVATAVVETVFPTATPPMHDGSYFVRVLSTTTVKLYLTAADANADTNAIDFSNNIAAGITMTLQQLSGISHITAVGNLFYDVDQLATAKEGNFYTLLNNTVISQNNTGSEDAVTGVVNFADETYRESSGMYLEGNIIHSAQALVRNYPGAGLAQTVTFNNNLFPPGMTWGGLGSGNTSADARLNDISIPTPGPYDYPRVAAQIRQKFGLQPGSPARGTGPNGTDKGGVRPLGVSIGGAPVGTTSATNATLTVGTRMTDNGIASGPGAWQNGSGWTHYKWRIDNGAWSAETPTTTLITLNGLANGTHTVEVSGRNDAGTYQDSTDLGDIARVSSVTWTVDTNYTPPGGGVRINEVLAANTTVTNFGGVYPDMIELYNTGSAPIDLGGWGLTDNSVLPYKYTIPNGTTLAAGAMLVVYASNEASVPVPKTGFQLKQSGDNLVLTKSASQGGGIVDSIAWGQQIENLSIGRSTDGAWDLCVPSFGAPNVLGGKSPASGVRINEWLANAVSVFANEFIELYNPASLPVDIGGHYLTDNPGGWPSRSAIRALTFIPAKGYVTFKADGDTTQGPDHVNFELSALQGDIGFMSPALAPVDTIVYGPQRTDVSEGRSPNGAVTIAAFTQPTPGAPNPGIAGSTTTNTVNLLAGNATWRYFQNAANGPTNDSSNRPFFHQFYNDTQAGLGWLPASGGAGQALYIENSNFPAAATNEGFAKTTLLTGFTLTRPWQTYYFRTHFNYSGSLNGVTLTAKVMCDDGAVIYLNGALVRRLRVTDDPVLHTSTASQAPEVTVETITIPADQLLVGDNVLAVSVHQDSTQSAGNGSSDIVWTMKLDASVPVPPSESPIVINEVLPVNSTLQNPDSTFVGWIELYNPSGASVSIADFSLTNEVGLPRKFVLPAGTSIAAGGRHVIFCNPAAAASATNTGFAFDGAGDQLYLFKSAVLGGGLLDSISFGQQVPDHSLARVPDATGSFVLGSPTRGAANTAASVASVTSVKLNEWVTNPSVGQPTWFELFNTAAQPVQLGGNYLTDQFTLRTKHLIPPHTYLGAAGASRWLQFIADNDFSATHNHVSFTLEPGEGLGLFSAAANPVDTVATTAQAVGASQGRYPDGTSAILTMPPTPGAANTQSVTDSDGDGLPDAYEIANGLNPNNPADAALDADGDGQTNAQEYAAGTNPQDPNNSLTAVVVKTVTPGQYAISFSAVAGKAYSVRYKDDLSATWTTLQQFPSQPSSGTVTAFDTPPGGTVKRFYQVITPQQP